MKACTRTSRLSDFESLIRCELALVSEQSFEVLQTIETTVANQNALSQRVKKLSNRLYQSRPPQDKNRKSHH